MASLSLDQFKVLQSEGSQLIDSRPTNDFASSFIPNSVNASLNGSYEYMASCTFDKEKHLVVICDAGREGESILRLESEGFKDISTFNFDLWNGNMHSINRVKAKEAHNFVDIMKDVSNAEDWEVLHVKGVKSFHLVGIITDGDLRRLLLSNKDISKIKVKEVMSVNPLTISKETLMIKAKSKMLEAKVQALVVTNQKNLIQGIIQIY